MNSDHQSQTGARLPVPPVHRISIVQLVVLMVFCLGLGFRDVVLAYSAFAGGMIAIVPQAWFAHRVFRRRGARPAAALARDSYGAETGKFLLAIAGFAVVFALVRPVAGWAVFAGYGVMLVIQVVGAWKLLRKAVASHP